MVHLPENLLTVWADVLLDTLSSAGIREVVVSPGSRSTPFLLAAERHPRLRLHAIIDERAAAFFALGLARTQGTPPLLLCTSGTAPAHYYPAVIEASEASLPLVVLSADRPFELAGSGAPQTTDQQQLFGVHARRFADLGAPDPSDAALLGLRRTVARAVELSLGPAPGPVHINARARKPLEPAAATSEAGRDLRSRADRLPRITPARAGAPNFDPAALAPLRARLAEARRPALVAGPLPLDAPRSALLDFARDNDIAVLAEASSQLRFAPREGVLALDAFDWWLAPALAPERAPDLIVEVGSTPTSANYARWLASSGPAHRYVLGGRRFRDPSGRADRVLLGDLGAIIDDIGPCAGTREHDPLAAADAHAWETLDSRLQAEDVFSEAAAVRAIVDALPAGALLALGNSLPIRHVDRFVRGRDVSLDVLTQRGVNGIDGWIAGSAGASIGAERPLLAILGDVTFSHDIGALAVARRAAQPLVFVVLDNGGGRIFEQLPIASQGIGDDAMALFTTPPRIDLSAAAQAFGVAYAEVSAEKALGPIVASALGRPGVTLIRVVVPEGHAAEQKRAIGEAL